MLALTSLSTPELLKWRAELLKDWDESLHPRDEGGRFSDGGGQFGSLSMSGAQHPLIRDGGVWGFSHAASRQITGASAQLMGIPGYAQGRGSGDTEYLVEDRPRMFLAAISGDRLGSETLLYHGFPNLAGTTFQEGDTLSLPLTASCSDKHTAGIYSGGYGLPEGTQGVLFEFPSGTPMAGYSWDAEEKQWSEALVAGRYVVSGVRSSAGDHYLADGVIVSLRPTEVFDPTTQGWQPVNTRLLKWRT